jgi:lysophospholipase L1-like esterase
MAQITSMAALGSSYAAGPGIPPVLNRGASRSGRNYAHVAAARLGARLADLTVSGATTANVLDTPQRVLLRKFGPQIEGVHADADLVTVTAGGNDLGYIKAALAACVAGTASVDKAAQGLRQIVEAIARRCPHARVVLVDYLPLSSDATLPQVDVPLDAAQIPALRALYDGVIQAFARAAETSGAVLVQASVLGQGHELGSASPWVHSFRLLGPARLGASLHPSAQGMRAIGEHIAEIAVS